MAAINVIALLRKMIDEVNLYGTLTILSTALTYDTHR